MKKNRGFTLLEVLIAVAILGIGILAVMQLFPSALTQSRIAAQRTVATELASSQAATLRTMDLSPGTIREWLRNNAARTLTESERIYEMYDGWQSTAERIPGPTNTYRVTLRVNMPDGRIETFVTYVTRP